MKTNRVAIALRHSFVPLPLRLPAACSRGGPNRPMRLRTPTPRHDLRIRRQSADTTTIASERISRFCPPMPRPTPASSSIPRAFLRPKYCGHCHQEAHAEWRQSAHANSFRAPWYVKNVNLLINGKGIEFARHCEGCHNPIALTSGAMTENSPVNRKFDQDGVTCSVCHAIQKVDARGTGSYVLGPAGGNGGCRRQAGVWRGIGQGDSGTSRPPLKSGDEGFLPHQRFLFRLPQGGVAQAVERLQMAACDLSLRRMAALVFCQRVTASVLRERSACPLARPAT